MTKTCFRIGAYLLAVATLMLGARFIMPMFVGDSENMAWEILILFAIILYIISAILLFIGRKDQ